MLLIRGEFSCLITDMLVAVTYQALSERESRANSGPITQTPHPINYIDTLYTVIYRFL